MTQEELAQAAGVGRSAINSYEVGRHSPRLDTLDRLLAVLGIDLAALAAVIAELEDTPDAPRRRYRPPASYRPTPPWGGRARGVEESPPTLAPATDQRTPFLDPVGRGLRRLRTLRRRTLAEVAAAAGISASSLSRIEHGRLRPKLATVGEILRALGADLLLLGLVVRLEDEAPQSWLDDASGQELLAFAIAACGLEEVLRSIEAERENKD